MSHNILKRKKGEGDSTHVILGRFIIFWSLHLNHIHDVDCAQIQFRSRRKKKPQGRSRHEYFSADVASLFLEFLIL